MSEGTEAIRVRILQDAGNEAEQILGHSEERAQQILREVEERVKESREKRLDEGKRYAEEASERALADSQVEFRRLLSEEKEKLFEEICGTALNRLREFSATDQYSNMLQDLVVEAGVILGGGILVVYLNEEDKARLKKRALNRIAKRIRERIREETSIERSDSALDTLGGAVVSRKGENVSVDNTFEARLGRIKEEKKSEVYRILFEE